MAIQGLGSRALAGRPGSAAKAAAFDRLGLQVTPENVLAVYQGLATEAARLNAAVFEFQHENYQGMPLPGTDPISHWVKPGFDQTTDKLITRCQADVDDLQSIADNVREAAITYGKSEAEITKAFDRRTFQPSPTAADLPSILRPMFRPPHEGPAPGFGTLLRGGVE
jgi:hypothetical protein